MASSFASKRLAKELSKLNSGLPPGIELISADNFEEWIMDIKVLDDNPLYKDQVYRLKFKFSQQYPIGMPPYTYQPLSNSPSNMIWSTEPPEVTFVKTTERPIPMHPHIYSNGIICLDLLGSQGWSPVQNVESVCMSIQSMLTGNEKNERPAGDDEFVRSNRLRPRDIDFYYHDNTV
ncbi:ubiquitin-conjugating enzyme [Colletotrichum acutatum]